MKNTLIAVLLLIAVSGLAFAGPERSPTADAFYEDGGNTFRPIRIYQSSSTVVLISSKAADSGIGTSFWRTREIVNMSTNSALVLYPNNVEYTTYSSTFGIHLSSDPAGLGDGDSWKTSYQGAIWGIWSPGPAPGGQGAGGYETYWK